MTIFIQILCDKISKPWLSLTVVSILMYLHKLPGQLSSLRTADSAWGLGFIFDGHLTFSDEISALFKFCYHQIREPRTGLPSRIIPHRTFSVQRFHLLVIFLSFWGCAVD